MNFCGKRSDLPLPRKRDRKKEKSVVSFTHEQNIICSQTKLDDIAHEENIMYEPVEFNIELDLKFTLSLTPSLAYS